MGHHITAIILKGNFEESKIKKFDLQPIRLNFDLTLFHIDHYYSACWQHQLGLKEQLDIGDIDCFCFPKEIALAQIMQSITGNSDVEYAIILTDYHAGIGQQFATVFKGTVNQDKSLKTINDALKILGVVKDSPLDEFDTIGLINIRSQPNFLEKYVDLAEEYGI